MSAGTPEYWDTGPHAPINIEATWDEFVQANGGRRIDSLISKSPIFENADYLFESSGIIAELKQVETEFSRRDAFKKGFDDLHRRLTEEDSGWKPGLLGGKGTYPPWFYPEFVRLFRPPISRILKKANRQLRESKAQFDPSMAGVLFFVNDEFTTLGPDIVRSLACSLLANSYSSIDCFVYLTVNRYIALSGSDVPRLVWMPSYSDRVNEGLHQFINDLGRNWFQFIQGKIGPFTIDHCEVEDDILIRGSRPIVLPS